MNNTKELYGIEPMTFDEEMALWREHEAQAQTRNNKRRMCVALDKLAKAIECQREYVKHIPEEDKAEHAQKVNDLTTFIEHIEKEFGDGFFRIVYGVNN